MGLQNSKVQVFASRKTDNWATPKRIYEHYMREGFFDPCPLNSPFDGLNIEWQKKNFVNPPYSQLKRWIVKAIEENKKGNEVTMLIPARTDTEAFKQLFIHGCKFYFIKGRVHYNDDKNGAPFPSMIVELQGNWFQNRMFLLEGFTK